MSKLLNLHHSLKHYVAHIEDDETALRVARALVDCTPANACLSLVNSNLATFEQVSDAYRNKYSIKAGAGWLGLRAEAQSEDDYCKHHDI